MATLNGTAGNDVLVGDDANAAGVGGDDTIHGGAGDDVIDGRGGNNFLYGDDGDDTFKLGTQAVQSGHLHTVIDGGAGFDTVEFSGTNFFYVYSIDGSTIGLEEKTGLSGTILGNHIATGIEALRLDGGNATIDLDDEQQGLKIISNAASADIWTGLGDDTVLGGAGSDIVHYDGGNDKILMGGGNNGLDIEAISNQVNHVIVDGAPIDSIYIHSDAIRDVGAYIDFAAHTIVMGSTTFDTGHIERVSAVSSDHAVTALGDDNENDILIGNDFGTAPVIIDGRGGYDELSGYGNVTLWGGGDSDYIYADEGNVWVSGDGSSTDSAQHPSSSFGGSDTITTGSGNDHVYGNAQFAVPGTPDGADHIYAGFGNDYVNGNAGADRIEGGPGSDRIYGGADDDLLFGDDDFDPPFGQPGNDHLNGNKGRDTLHGGAGNDELYGGQDGDQLYGEDGNDTASGDAGDDWISGGAGLDTLIGGAGRDEFAFQGADAAFSTSGQNAGAADLISDFKQGDDSFALGFATTAILTGVQADFAAALVMAQQLLDTHAGDHEVAAIHVGLDTLLFYAADAGGHIDSAIRLLNVDPAVLTATDFVN